EIASGDYGAFAKLEQEVQDLVRGRFQGPEFSQQVAGLLQVASRESLDYSLNLAIGYLEDLARSAVQTWQTNVASRRSLSRSLAALSRRPRHSRGVGTVELAEVEEDSFRWNWQDIKNLPNGLNAAYRQ
ncbi:hypothetical protein VOLCADRAFT_101463, partial [Volvox carteri f. nagariensis]